MIRLCVLPLFLGVMSSAGQVPVVPSLTVEQTRVPVFGDWKTDAGRQVVEHGSGLANFRLHLEYRIPAEGKLGLRLGEGRVVDLPGGAGAWRTLEVEFEQLPGKAAGVRAMVDGVAVPVAGGAAEPGGLSGVGMGGDFTVMVRFAARGDGALLARCRPEKWEPDAKMLGLRGGRLFYDIGWLGVLSGRRAGLNDGQGHTAVLRVVGGKASLFVDGKPDGVKAGFSRPDQPGHGLHLGRGAQGFDGDLKDGAVENVRYWARGLSDEEARQLSAGKAEAVNTPEVNWSPGAGVVSFPGGVAGVAVKPALVAEGGAEVRGAWVQGLGAVDHAGIIAKWDGDSLAEGARIYQQLCITCHGNVAQEGSMPTSRRFHREAFKNGSDPFRQFQTLTQGYGLMMPLPQYSAEQKYALVQYIRETFLAPHNASQMTKVDAGYLAALPRAMQTLPRVEVQAQDTEQYLKMDYGPALTWTYQTGREQIAYKGVAVRLDAGAGGVSRGRAWMVFDHDTMSAAAVTAGSFIDWKGVAFDGSHNSHASLTGERLCGLPPGPGWAEPGSGKWDDPRLRGRDGKPYGPLPRTWAQYKGMYLHGALAVQSYTVGEAAVLEGAEAVEYGAAPVFLRTLNVGRSPQDMRLRLTEAAPGLSAMVLGAELKTVNEGGLLVLEIPAGVTPVNFVVALTRNADAATVMALAKGGRLPMDLRALTEGGPPRWPETVKTLAVPGGEEGAFATDVLTHPDGALNPWQSWMRLTGFDFFAGGDEAAVCTWMGDVWVVSGLAKRPAGELTWRRVATGLFQPLGLKIVDGTICVTCRDQLAKLRDLNGDGETDFIECFNNDHQVTEHFHEFAMGLQTDAAGNFYYAKSARHALPAIVPHHGTLLRVSADGSRTDILATGFRAANGVCLNPDGTFFVTDQEGHWIPKNRINLVQGKGAQEFYGNMMGYHDITDESDAAMKQPLCWITNAFDRSPSELLWVPKDAQWGPLNGALLNLSYGYGRIYTVPHTRGPGLPQGGMCALPMPQFPTGVMRGRFHPGDGQFYGCGMFAWAGNQSQPGGFYRVRYTGKPALQPVGLRFAKGEVRIQFSDAPEAASAAVKSWSLKRSKNYGSQHYDEHGLKVERVETNGPALTLHVPDLAPAMGIEIVLKLKAPGGAETERVIHGTVHQLE